MARINCIIVGAIGLERMQNYLSVYYNGTSTTFTYTSTEEEARGYLTSLIGAGLVRPQHTMSIVRLVDEKLIYYKRNCNTVDSLTYRPLAKGFVNTTLTYWLGIGPL